MGRRKCLKPYLQRKGNDYLCFHLFIYLQFKSIFTGYPNAMINLTILSTLPSTCL